MQSTSSIKGGVLFAIKTIISFTLCSPLKRLDVFRYSSGSVVVLHAFFKLQLDFH